MCLFFYVQILTYNVVFLLENIFTFFTQCNVVLTCVCFRFTIFFTMQLFFLLLSEIYLYFTFPYLLHNVMCFSLVSVLNVQFFTMQLFILFLSDKIFIYKFFAHCNLFFTCVWFFFYIKCNSSPLKHIQICHTVLCVFHWCICVKCTILNNAVIFIFFI